MKRVYILASERSGSNLLRVLLGKHKRITAPVAPHFLDFFSQIIAHYGDLKKTVNLKHCLHDFVANANLPYHNWDFHPDVEDLINKLGDAANLFTITDIMYTSLAESNNHDCYVSKGIHNFNYVGDILNHFPEAKFIYLHRDPRDHVVSWLKTPLFLHSPFVIVRKWRQEQEICLYLKQTYPDSIHQISYGELITDTQGVVDRIFKFLDLEIDPNCYSTTSDNKESQRNEFWKNLSKPVNNKNLNKYINTLSKADINLIESYCQNVMVTLGYNTFSSSLSWKRNKSYVFHFFDLFRRIVSRIRHRKFYHQEMKDLKQKLIAQEEIKNNLSKRMNDTRN